MEFGLFLNPQAPANGDAAQLASELIEQTRVAREAGFDLVTTGQHYLTDYVQLQLVPMVGRLAAEAGKMTVGTGVVLLPLHHPIEIAEQVATLDALAEEVVVGVGAGYRDVEFESFGVPKAERGQRLAEGIELMNHLWTESDVTYDGRFYAVQDVAINPRPTEKPRVWVAANARPAIERAARLGDAWFVNPHATIGEIRAQKRRYDELRSRHGADTSVPILREAFVASTTEAAVETAREHLAAKYRRYTEWGQDEAMEDDDDLHRPFDDLAVDRFLLGTPAEVCAAIERYREALDASHLVLRVAWPGLASDRACECIELIGDEVIPNV